MATAAAIIERARDAHPAFTRNQTPDAVALRLLRGVRTRVFSAAMRAHRAAFIVTTAYPLTDTDVSTGLTVDASLYVENVRMQVMTDIIGLPLLESAHEESPYPVSGWVARYATLSGQEFTTLQVYPRDPAAWADTPTLYLDRIPALPELAESLTTEIGLAPASDDVLSTQLAIAMATRGSGDPRAGAIPLQPLMAVAAADMDAYLLSLAEQRRGKIFRVQEGVL